MNGARDEGSRSNEVRSGWREIKGESSGKEDSCWLIPVATVDIEQTNIRILANPVESWLDISDPDQQVVEVNVYDFIGRIIYRGEEMSINMENAPQGYYMVSFKLKSGHILAHKILKM